MTDKEHLEGVKNLIDKYEKCYDKEIALKYASDLMRYHARYFVKQAERVQELEEDVEYLSHNFGIEAEQNKRYREAIKKAKNAMSLVVGGEGSATKTAHNILREALEGEE